MYRLTPGSIRYMHVVLHGALEQAKKEGMIVVNPADAVRLPKEEKKEIQFLDNEGVARFIVEARKSKHFAAYYLELATGLRRRALLGLRWSDVDMKQRTVTVSQSLVRTRGGLKFHPPKTKLSNKTLDVPEAIMAELRAHKRSQNAEKLKAGTAWVDHGLVFCTAIGEPYEPRAFAAHFERLLQAAGLPRMPFHSLRHTFATLSLQQGVDMRTTQENPGHVDPGFTLRVYSGVTRKMKKEATDKIGDLLKSLSGEPARDDKEKTGP